MSLMRFEAGRRRGEESAVGDVGHEAQLGVIIHLRDSGESRDVGEKREAAVSGPGADREE